MAYLLFAHSFSVSPSLYCNSKPFHVDTNIGYSKQGFETAWLLAFLHVIVVCDPCTCAWFYLMNHNSNVCIYMYVQLCKHVHTCFTLRFGAEISSLHTCRVWFVCPPYVTNWTEASHLKSMFIFFDYGGRDAGLWLPSTFAVFFPKPHNLSAIWR